MIPKELLCIFHQELSEETFYGVLYHQLDVIRRTGCDCDMDILWLWYDLIGFQFDI